jgi:hypothetical protein
LQTGPPIDGHREDFRKNYDDNKVSTLCSAYATDGGSTYTDNGIVLLYL